MVFIEKTCRRSIMNIDRMTECTPAVSIKRSHTRPILPMPWFPAMNNIKLCCLHIKHKYKQHIFIMCVCVCVSPNRNIIITGG